MPPVFRYSDPRGVTEPATMYAVASNVRWGTLAVTNSAELGQPAISTVAVEDWNAEWNFVGLRAFEVRESSAGSNNQIIGRFAIQDRAVTRGASSITSNARTWTMDLVDYNFHLGKRILVDSDAKRPAETAGDRIRWLLNRAAHINLNDYGHVAYPSDQMDAADYRGQRPTDVLADCAIETGYLYWCDYNEAHGTPELFFLDPAGSSYASTLYISNDLDYVDSALCFAPYEDAVLRRSASRIAYGVYLAYANGSVYVRKDSTGDQFAKVDQTAPMSNVKSSGRATRIANHFLNDNDTEDDRLTLAIKVPQASVNLIRHGHLVNVKLEHMPGYETWTKMRVLRRTVIQEEEGGNDYYKLVLEMGMSDTAGNGSAPPYTGSAFAALVQLGRTAGTRGAMDANGTGDSPPGGWYAEPTVGSMWTFATSGGKYTSITTSQAMHVRVEAMAFAGPSVVPGETGTLELKVNGAIVASHTQSGLGNWNFSIDTEIDLAAGDVVTLSNSGSGGCYIEYYPASPQSNYLRVGRGTHVWNTGTVTWVGPS